MENDFLKYCITYLIDTGASKKCIINKITYDDFFKKELKKQILETDVLKVVDEMIKEEELAFDEKSDMLYVVEFMPKTAGKINGKEYKNVKNKWSYYIEKFEKKNG